MRNVQFLEIEPAKKLNGKERNPMGFVMDALHHQRLSPQPPISLLRRAPHAITPPPNLMFKHA